MKTVGKITKFEVMVEKSRFISVLYPLETFEEASEVLKRVRKEYPKASHYCSAIIYNERAKSNDDGEPHGTAGRPILDVLLHQQMNRVLLVVIRYFGGTKLGAGRLLSTYVDAAAKVIDISQKYFIGQVNHYEIGLDFSQENTLIAQQENLQYQILERQYSEKGLVAMIESISPIKEELISLFGGKIMLTSLGTKEKLIKEEGK